MIMTSKMEGPMANLIWISTKVITTTVRYYNIYIYNKVLVNI
jgi:hypothetical protein